MNNDNKPILTLYTKTWARDSHGLFDYECQQTKNKHIYVFGQGRLLRKSHEVCQINETRALTADEQLLADINYQDEEYNLSSLVKRLMEPSEDNINSLQNKIWMIIKADSESNPNSNIQMPVYEEMNDYVFG